MKGRNGYVVDLDQYVADGDLIELSVGASVVDLLQAAQKLTDGKGKVFCVVEGDIRLTYDGSDPASGAAGAGTGMPFYDGALLEESGDRANAIKLIRYDTTTATVWIQKLKS